MYAVFDNNWTKRDRDENQSTTPSRSLALEFGGIQVTESTSEMAPPLPYPQANSVGLPPLHAAPGKQIGRTAIPVEDNPAASTWDLMGFTYNPSELAFGRANDEISPSKRECAVEHEGLNNAMGNLSASEMEMRRQRRLRVFQEMTPSKTLQV